MMTIKKYFYSLDATAAWSKLFFLVSLVLLLLTLFSIPIPQKETLAKLSLTRTPAKEVSVLDSSLSRVQGQLLMNGSAFTGILVKRAPDGTLVQSTEYHQGKRRATGDIQHIFFHAEHHSEKDRQKYGYYPDHQK